MPNEPLNPYGRYPNAPLYRATRTLVQQISASRVVLDLGCNQLTASGPLADAGLTVIGIDRNLHALRQARARSARAHLILADLRHGLPLRPDTAIDTVLALDLLEHLPETQALALLRALPATLPRRPLHLIVSMPVIVPTSVAYRVERLKMAFSGRRPDAGLLDKTHQILTDQAGHTALFAQAGYGLIDHAAIDFSGRVYGPTTLPVPSDYGLWNRALSLFLRRVLPALLGHPRTARLIAYQGLYLLRYPACPQQVP